MTRVVVKVGSSSLVTPEKTIDEEYIERLTNQIADLVDSGVDVVLVTSGAIAAALGPLGFNERPGDIPTLQALASVGQVQLIDIYAKQFAKRGRCVGQVLLTRNDTGSRSAYLHARETMERLMSLGVVPVVNENDTVSVDEIRFGDNDSLAAIVGAMVSADLVIILSDIDGLYTANPRNDPNATLIDRVEEVDESVMALAGSAGSSVGTGGMLTKVRAAKALQMSGIPMAICSARRPNVLSDVVRGQDVGTLFSAPKNRRESARKVWIGFAGHDMGAIVIDNGARSALHSGGGSLLPVGITSVEGSFARGSVVAVRDASSTPVARGITRYSSDEIELTRGMRLDMVSRVVPDLASTPVIHRDELVVF